MSATFRRVVISRFGSPEALDLVEEAVPQPGPGQVRVRMEAAGVAYGDVLARYGVMTPARLPFTPGFDVVGTIEAVGPGVTGRTVGERVAALVVTGGYAEAVCVPVDRVVPLPGGVDAVDAAATVLTYTTAYQLLHRVARVASGQTVLVHGGAGGVGTALLQLSRLAGARTFGTASAGKSDVVRALGATAIDYRAEDFVRRVRDEADGADVVFDAIGGRHLDRSRRALRRRGVVVMYGMANAVRDGRLDRGAVVRAGLAFVRAAVHPGTRVRTYDVRAEAAKRPVRLRSDLVTVLDLMADGSVSPVLGGTYPLSQVRAAHQALERGDVSGKIVLTVT